MPEYNPKNERIKRDYFRHQKEACGKAAGTVDGIRKAISRFEAYTGFKDLVTFNKEQAIGFKKHLARAPGAKTGRPIATSTMVATTNALSHFFQWLSAQPGYRGRLRRTDIDYLQMSENEMRAVREPSFKSFPTLEQIRAVVRQMPNKTEVDRRDRALVSLAILTGARDSAIASLRLKHIDVTRELVMQDPREVRTKRRKRIDTFFFPMGEEFKRIVEDWVRHLKEIKLFGNDDPLFPRTCVQRDSEGVFAVSGVESVFWENTQPIRRIFYNAFAAAGLPYFRPHSFRDTLVQFGERHAPTIEHFKAWSQNLGHEHVSTTLTSYGTIGVQRQSELVRSMAGAEEARRDDPAVRALFDQFMRVVGKQTRAAQAETK